MNDASKPRLLAMRASSRSDLVSFFRVCADCGEKITWNSLQFAIDLEFIDNAFDLLHGQLPSAPESLCLFLAHSGCEFLEPGVGYEGNMGGCMGGFARANAFQVDHRHPASSLLQKIGGGDTRNSRLRPRERQLRYCRGVEESLG